MWAPWRMAYVSAEHDHEFEGPRCVFCDLPARGNDASALILARGEHCFVIMNAYPYASGHLMVVPYAHLDRLDQFMQGGCAAVIDKYNLPGYTVGVGSKGCVTFARNPIVDYESFKAQQDGELCDLAWLYNMNRGVFMTPGREEEWTLSIQHTVEDCQRFIDAFEEMASDLTA